MIWHDRCLNLTAASYWNDEIFHENCAATEGHGNNVAEKVIYRLTYAYRYKCFYDTISRGSQNALTAIKVLKNLGKLSTLPWTGPQIESKKVNFCSLSISSTLCLSLSLFPTLSLSLPLPLILSLSLYIYISVSLMLQSSLALSLYLSLSLSPSLLIFLIRIYLSLSPCLPVMLFSSFSSLFPSSFTHLSLSLSSSCSLFRSRAVFLSSYSLSLSKIKLKSRIKLQAEMCDFSYLYLCILISERYFLQIYFTLFFSATHWGFLVLSHASCNGPQIMSPPKIADPIKKSTRRRRRRWRRRRNASNSYS